MKINWRNQIAVILSVLTGVVFLYFGTDGFQAFTAESARINRLMEETPQFPDVTLEDSKERVYNFDSLEGKHVLLTFIYTACTDVCPQLEMNFAELYEEIPDHYIGEDVVFLSISFDPTRDDPETLERYRASFGSDGETWRMARITEQSELDALLEEFGVIVIPDGNGGFQHNSAFYFVNRDGYLEEVMDYQQIDKAAKTVTQVLEEEMEG